MGSFFYKKNSTIYNFFYTIRFLFIQKNYIKKNLKICACVHKNPHVNEKGRILISLKYKKKFSETFQDFRNKFFKKYSLKFLFKNLNKRVTNNKNFFIKITLFYSR